MYCPYCGAENNNSSTVCAHCGKQMPRPMGRMQKPKKKHTALKVILGILGGFVLLIIIVGMFDTEPTMSENDAPSVISAQTPNSADNSTVKAENQPKTASSKIGNYEVTILSAQVVKNTSDGKYDLIVTYSFTNNATESKAFGYAVSPKLFQNGVEIPELWSRIGIEDYYDFDNQHKEIKPGTTLEVQEAYELAETTTEVEVEISEWISLSKKTISYTISLAEIEIPE